MSKKFIDKKNAKTYNLVYRSQEDPLAFEEGSTDRVFVEAGKRPKPAKSDVDRATLDLAGLRLDGGEAGQAALYGVYLDDRSYDYTKHLRTVGTGGGMLLEAPAKKERHGGIELRDSTLPAEVLPSQHRMDIKGAAYPQGLQPDMDPNLREVLEALSDDGDTGDFDDDFLGKLNADELSDEDADGFGGDDDDFDPNDVFAQVQRMKQQRRRAQSDDGSDAWSGSGGGRAPSTNFSMTSSAMFRNGNLTQLDERYDQIEAMYEQSDGDSDDGRYDSDGRYVGEYDSDGNLVPISSRADFESVLNEFLNDYELTGKKMQPVLAGGSGAGKLDKYRDGLAEDALSRRAVVQAGERISAESAAKSKEQDDAEIAEMFREKERTPWDCQSILSTYSTLDNHPATIYEERAPRIRVSRKSGFPIVEPVDAASDNESDGDGDDEPRENKGQARPKGESAEEKRARKKQVQEQRRLRREQKRENRGVYAEKQDRRMQSKNDRRQHVVNLG
ncbi:Protein ltv1 [Coemansia sp. RSA 2610]|nr:Protein ltv1 [Coemansia sp. RSA 2610]